MSETEILMELAKKDTELIKASKALNEIPEAAQIIECRAKRKEIKAKQDQVVELTDEVNEKIANLEAEETKLLEKLKDLQDTVDHTSDYRVTTSVTKDMEGATKRLATISQETDDLLERQIKIDHLGDQVADMLEKLDAKEHRLTTAFKVKGAAAKKDVDAAQGRIDELLPQLPAALQKRYARLKDEKGRPVAFMEDGHCSACHSTFPTGQLAKLKAGPEVTECPNCHRIFVMIKE